MKNFAVPIFEARVYFTRDRSEAVAWEVEHGFDTALADLEGTCSNDHGRILVFVDRDDPGLLAHECLHAASAVLKHIGAEDYDEEVMGHLTQWLVNRCLRTET